MALLEHDCDWLWESDARHRVRSISQGYRAATGIDPSRLVGRSCIETLLKNASGRAENSGHLEDLYARRPFRDFVYEMREGGGASMWVSISGIPLLDAQGVFLGYRGTARNVTAQLNVLEAARAEAEQSRSRLQAAIDALEDGFVLWDKEDRLVACNEAFARQYSFLPGLQIGRTCRDIFIDFVRTGVVEDARGQEEAWVDRHIARRDDELGKEIEFLTHEGRWMLRRDVATQTGDRVGIRTDITEYKQREAQLAEATHTARTLAHDLERSLDSMAMGVAILDAELNVAFVNEAFFEIWSMSREDFAPGDTFLALMEMAQRTGLYDLAPDQWEDYVAFRIDEIRCGDVAPRDFDRADGRRLIYSVTSLSGGRRLVSYYDITAMKEREAQLAEALEHARRRENESHAARNYLAAILESLPAGIIIYDSEDRFVLANRTLQDTFPALAPAWRPEATFLEAVELAHEVGYFRQSGNPCVDALYDEDPHGWVEAYMDLHRRPHSLYERRNPDGRWFQVIDTWMPDGSFIGIRIDISELKQRESELREVQDKAVLADRAKSEFLANMSHEIRTPMNGVLGMAELLARSELDERQRTFTDIIVKSGNALLTVINDILDFSKIDAGRLALDPAPFNLVEAIEDVAMLVSARAREKDIELIVRVQPGLHDAYLGDGGRIRQIVTNLVGNAVKFTDAGHVMVDVSGEDRGESTVLRIAVTDTGIGIPTGKLASVFDTFSQVDASSTRRHEGTGLGLAITSRLVGLMGGKVGVRSREGEGSTFHVTLPLAKAATPRQHDATPADVAGARLIVVDSNPVSRSVLLEQLRGWGFDACAVAEGEEGLALMKAVAARGLAADCILIDCHMPDMTGIDLARNVRDEPEFAVTAMLMLASVDQSPVHMAGIDTDAHLIKPVRSRALLEAIVASIRKRRTEPRRRETAPSATPPKTLVPETDAKRAASLPRHRLDILVAEDNEVNQLVFTHILKETGLSYEIVGNGRLAVEAHGQMNPRMILMDVSMPQMNGLEAAAKIREAEAGSGLRVPIVGVTAHALKGDRERCLEAGMDDYLSKPISPDALIRKIGRWIDAGAARDSQGAAKAG